MESQIRAKTFPSYSVRKRNDIDIMAIILRASNKGTKKTRIMYRCNLNHKQLQAYLQLLLDMEFLESHSKKEGAKPNFFRTTSKGTRFLNAYRTLQDLMT